MEQGSRRSSVSGPRVRTTVEVAGADTSGAELDLLKGLASTEAPEASLAERMARHFDALVGICQQRAEAGYGDALANTGHYLNTYSLVERKMDRLRGQIWRRALEGHAPVYHGAFDSIDDAINYLLFLRFQLEDLLSVADPDEPLSQILHGLR